MRQNIPEDTSARTPSPRFSTTDFDCELPDDAREELSPRRAKILGGGPGQRPPVAQHAPSPWREYFWAIILLAALVTFIALCSNGTYQVSPQVATPAATPAAPSALVRPTAPVATPIIPTTPRGPAIPTTPEVRRAELVPAPMAPVRRAELVPVPVHRATLWRLPSQPIGVYAQYPLPDVWGGGSVWARYMGTVERFSQIPPNPIPGDLWNVVETGASWIYCVPTGYSHAAWIDP